MSGFPLPHAIRPAVDADFPVIASAWTKEGRHAPAARFVRDADYFTDQRVLVIRILRVSRTLVSCRPDDVNKVFGFITFGPGPIVHWVYTKDSYRRIGLADDLLAAAFPNRGPEDELYATQAGRMWGELEPYPSREELARLRAKGEGPPPGALTRRRIFFRPYLLVTNLLRAS